MSEKSLGLAVYAPGFRGIVIRFLGRVIPWFKGKKELPDFAIEPDLRFARKLQKEVLRGYHLYSRKKIYF